MSDFQLLEQSFPYVFLNNIFDELPPAFSLLRGLTSLKIENSDFYQI